MSLRTLHRRVCEVACWRRPRLVAKGDPDRAQVLADLHRQLRELPTGAVVLAEDETHLNLLPWVRSTWIPYGSRQEVMHSGRCFSQVCRKAVSASFTAFLSSSWSPTRPRQWWRWSATT
jgi:hypothetical protein